MSELELIEPINGICNDCSNNTFNILIYRGKDSVHFEHKCTKCGSFFMKEETELKYKTATRISYKINFPSNK